MPRKEMMKNGTQPESNCPTAALPPRIKRRILWVMEKQGVAGVLPLAFLSTSESVFVSSMAEARKCRWRNFDWLIIQQTIREDERGNATSAYQLAEKWVKEGRRAIIVTNRRWDQLTFKLQPRITILPLTAPFFAETISDIIHAGEGDVDYIPPTIVSLELTKGTATPGEPDLHLAYAKSVEGPLADFVNSRLGLRPLQSEGYHNRTVVNHFEPFRQIDRKSTGKSLDAILHGRHHDPHVAWQAHLDRYASSLGCPKSGLMRKLIQANHDACLHLGLDESNGNRCILGPYPIHLHLYADPELLGEPLDLVRLHTDPVGDRQGYRHLCTTIPIVWRLPGDAPEPNGNNRDCNPTEYRSDSVKAICSCASKVKVNRVVCSAIRNVEGHTREIIKHMGLTDLQPISATSKQDVQRHFGGNKKQIEIAHLTTHGIWYDKGERAGIVLGPKTAASDTGESLTSLAIRSNRNTSKSPNKGPIAKFVFVNSCGVASQLSPKKSAGRIVGSFAQGLLSDGVCGEVIGHRWAVGVQPALKLAEYFYQSKPVTVHARAAALQQARLKVLDESKQNDGKNHFWHTWMAPVHIWQYS